MTHSVNSTHAVACAVVSSAAIGLSIACILVAALALAGAPAVPALLFGTVGAFTLAAALSGLFTYSAFATSFAFADARAQPRR